MDFEVVDIMKDADGMQRLLKFGVRNVPVVAKGDEYVFGQVIADVARLAGVRPPGQAVLSADVLVNKWLNILEAGQRIVKQMPAERIEERAIDSRDRSVRYLCFHIFRIAEAFLETTDGAVLSVEAPNVPPTDNEKTGDQIARYGAGVTARVAAWYEKTADKACAGKVETYYGMQPLRDVLERSTWHSAQHVRQITAVLERWGITPDRPMTAEVLKDLPMPSGLWE